MSQQKYPWPPCGRCRSKSEPHSKNPIQKSGYHHWCKKCQNESQRRTSDFEAMYRRWNEKAWKEKHK